MSETPTRMTLANLLDLVTKIANGLDKNGHAPGTEDHDPATTPSMDLQWCASILKIAITRQIESTTKLVQVYQAVFGQTKDGKVVAPGIVHQLREMQEVLQEIVNAIKSAQNGTHNGAAPAPQEQAADNQGGQTFEQMPPQAQGPSDIPGMPPAPPPDPAEIARLAELSRKANEAAQAAGAFTGNPS